MGTSGTALTGGAVAAILMLSSGASVAEGWTAVPSAPSAAAVAAATAACNWVNDRNGPPILTGTPVLTDGRGSYTAAIYVDGHVAHICISNGQHEATGIATDNGRIAVCRSRTGPRSAWRSLRRRGQCARVSQPAATSGQEQDVHGLAGSDVAAVTFKFADGRLSKRLFRTAGISLGGRVIVGRTQCESRPAQALSPRRCLPRLAWPETTGCVFAGWKLNRPSAG